MDTYGLQPRKHWKLFEHEGFQVLAWMDPGDEDEYPDEEHWMLVLSGYVEALGATSEVKIGTGKLETAQKLFDALEDPEKAVTGWLNSVGPLVQKTVAGG